MDSPDALRNREHWDADADDYQRRNAGHINRDDPAWGLWQIPESELLILGDVSGKDVLELAFSGGTAIESVCYEPGAQRPEPGLQRPYFGLHREDFGEYVTFQLGYGDWIRLFVANGLAVEDLVEPVPAADAESTYRDDHDREWARNWPMEQIWKLRKC